MLEHFTSKYQPKLLTDFTINNDLIDIIRTLAAMDNLNMLFIGNSGSGRTSLIQAIIREYYGEDIKLNHDNILTINTLKEQGISYYRSEVKIFCQTSSLIKNKKKILVLDDIDIINEQSQQVFRNCIDKYSNNVVFLASCSNTQKVIESLQSRMNVLNIKSPSEEQLKNIAVRIINAENINVNNEVLSFIVKVCNGSIRILINYLEKFKLLNKSIDFELANKVCTNISFIELEKYTKYCKENKLSNALKLINSLIVKGYSVTDILDSYFTFVKITDTLAEEKKYNIIPLLCKYIAIFHDIHEDEIELSFFTNNLINLLQE
uniref:Uncharacterized protein n=1 Tax=viral metagenome TaxID=1070528 RepID=A0A6C0CS54_9ZZZZ